MFALITGLDPVKFNKATAVFRCLSQFANDKVPLAILIIIKVFILKVFLPRMSNVHTIEIIDIEISRFIRIKANRIDKVADNFNNLFFIFSCS